MTDGSSQGLFVIVAVVIFGIFIVISYLLFRDKLQTGLASIFTDSLEQADLSLETFKSAETHVKRYSTTIKELTNSTYTLDWSGYNDNDSRWGDDFPTGIAFSIDNPIKVNYGYKLVVEYEILTPIDAQVITDLNATYKIGTEESNNDIYAGASFDFRKSISANTWTKLSFSYNNNNSKNTDNKDIYDHSIVGIRVIDAKTIKQNNQYFFIRNIKYKLVKI